MVWTGGLVLGACASGGGDDYVERPVENLYNVALDTMNKGNFAAAAKACDEVERQHP